MCGVTPAGYACAISTRDMPRREVRALALRKRPTRQPLRNPAAVSGSSGTTRSLNE